VEVVYFAMSYEPCHAFLFLKHVRVAILRSINLLCGWDREFKDFGNGEVLTIEGKFENLINALLVAIYYIFA
jgi:hypothetical protein